MTDTWANAQDRQPLPPRDNVDYWVVVALVEGLDGDEAVVVQASEDARYDALAEDVQCEYVLDMGWAKDRPPGLYRVWLAPSSHQDPHTGEVDVDVGARRVRALYVLSPDHRGGLAWAWADLGYRCREFWACLATEAAVVPLVWLAGRASEWARRRWSRRQSSTRLPGVD